MVSPCNAECNWLDGMTITFGELQVVEAVVLGRATLTKIKQNLMWALAYNAVGIPIAGELESCTLPPVCTFKKWGLTCQEGKR